MKVEKAVNTKVIEMCGVLTIKYKTVVAAAEACGIERTMFNRIALGHYRCGISPKTAKKIRDEYEKVTGTHVGLDEMFG